MIRATVIGVRMDSVRLRRFDVPQESHVQGRMLKLIGPGLMCVTITRIGITMTDDKHDLPTLVSQAKHIIANIDDLDGLKKLRDKAEVYRVYQQTIEQSREGANKCAEIRLRAERKMGATLREMELHRGGRPPENQSDSSTGSEETVPTLKDLGVKKQESHVYQKLANIPEDEFESYIAKQAQKGEITTAGALKLAKTVEVVERARENKAKAAVWDTQTLDELISSGQKIKTFLLDPNWQYETWGEAGQDRSASQHYGTLPTDDIIAMIAPLIKELAADDAVMILWEIDSMREDAMRLMTACGFQYKTVAFRWAKTMQTEQGPRFFKGMGHWTRGNIEQCILGTRGNPQRLSANVEEFLIADRMEHSTKPDEVRSEIEHLVEGPYLEMFCRGEPREGWFAWGHEAGEHGAAISTGEDDGPLITGEDFKALDKDIPQNHPDHPDNQTD